MAPYNLPRMDVGQMGVMYRIFTQGIAECPIFIAHGTEKGAGTNEEDSNQGFWGADMAAFKDLKPKADVMTVTIKPHTVQTVTVMLRNAPKAK